MEKPNIFLIVIDSARPDFLSSYSDEAVTPSIDELADEGVVFDRAYSPSGWTPPSHASLFTGKRPTEVGGTSPEPELEQGTETIASSLSNQNYRTVSLHTAGHITKNAGYDQGFDKYKDVRHEYHRKKSRDPYMWLDTALNRIWGRKDRTLFLSHLIEKEIKDISQPTFLFTNYQTAHRPYNPHRLALKRFVNTEVSEETQELIDSSKEELAEKGEINVSEKDREALINLGRAETYRVDHYIGKLVKRLKKEGKYQNSVLIITSDHGDNFGENNLFEHGYLTENNLHVPLIISGGAVDRKSRESSLVSTMYLKKFIEEISEGNEEEAFESLKTELAVSELGESSYASKYDFPWHDASISVIDGENQLLKRKNFSDIDGKIVERGIDYNQELDESLRQELEEKAGDFDNFEAAGNDFNNFDDEEVKSKLEDLGYM